MNRIKQIRCLFLIAPFLLLSCTDKSSETVTAPAKKPMEALPYSTIDLSNLKAFREVDQNWQIVGDVYVDRTQKGVIESGNGQGILVNTPDYEQHKDNLFTAFEHGDIDMELDVMMPVNSNSGLYFQGRYEVQLLDSWGVKEPKHSDMGGIYQRWDETKEKGDKGYEGRPPRINAAKAPGLWQHFKIKFRAPRFDESGNKLENARFEEVWLNGALLHENQEVSGPTRAAAFDDEQPSGPLMIQGDHGPVAMKNIRYKLYGDKKVSISGLNMKEYESATETIPDFDTVTMLREISSDSISSAMVTGRNSERLLLYTGLLNIPDPGEYLFELRLREGGGLLLINNDTIINLDGDYRLEEPGFGITTLSQENIPFTLIYNKHKGHRKGFALFVEGPGIDKHGLHAPGSLFSGSRNKPEAIVVKSSSEPVMQRSFLMHNGSKRTHCISVATPQGVNYSFDLAFGSLLKAWDNDFLDVTNMWHSRGAAQLGEPLGFAISSHGDPDFAYLENQKSPWPDSLLESASYTQLGYELDENGLPVFLQRVNESLITNKLVPSSSVRALNRVITTTGEKKIWHKIGEGGKVESLSDGTFAINDKSYFVSFPEDDGLEPIVRKSAGKDELIIKIPEGQQQLTYTITW